jgi:hypothetical protein
MKHNSALYVVMNVYRPLDKIENVVTSMSGLPEQKAMADGKSPRE